MFYFIFLFVGYRNEENNVSIGSYTVLWKTKYNVTPPTAIKGISDSQVLLMKCTWLTDQQQVWAPLQKVINSVFFHLFLERQNWPAG